MIDCDLRRSKSDEPSLRNSGAVRPDRAVGRPTSMAHGRLISTDMPCTVFCFLATFYFVRYMERPSWLNLLVAASLMGVAQVSKYSALWLFPVFLVAFILRRYAQARQDPKGAGLAHVRIGTSIVHGTWSCCCRAYPFSFTLPCSARSKSASATCCRRCRSCTCWGVSSRPGRRDGDRERSACAYFRFAFGCRSPCCPTTRTTFRTSTSCAGIDSSFIEHSPTPIWIGGRTASISRGISRLTETTR